MATVVLSRKATHLGCAPHQCRYNRLFPCPASAGQASREHSNMRLRDNVAIITGAGQGIGLATALKFAAEGARVVVCDINQEAASNAALSITRNGGQAISFRVDVTDKQ